VVLSALLKGYDNDKMSDAFKNLLHGNKHSSMNSLWWQIFLATGMNV